MKDIAYLQLVEPFVPDEPIVTEEGQEEGVAERSELRVNWMLYEQGERVCGAENVLVEDVSTALIEKRGDLFDLDVVLLLQGTSVFSTQVNIPSKQLKHIAQALPFALEDNLAEDVDNLHFVPCPRNSQGETPVLVIKHSIMAALVDRFNAANLSLTAVLPDMFSLPAIDNGWSIYISGDQLLIRLDKSSAISIELASFPIMLNALSAERPAESSDELPLIVDIVVEKSSSDDDFDSWFRTLFNSQMADRDVGLNISFSDADAFQYLCDHITENPLKSPVNLLVGSYKPILKHSQLLFSWKPVAALLAVFITLQVGFLYVQASEYEKQAAAIDAEAKQLYKRYFPRDKRIFDIKKQMRSHLQKAGNTNKQLGFLPMLANVGEKLNEINDGGRESVISPLKISFDEVQGEFKFDCLANGFGDLDNFKLHLEKLPLTVEIARATQDGAKVKARLKIRSAS